MARRSRAEIEEIEAAILDHVSTDHPMTVRGVFYRLVSDGIIPKTENAYKHTAARLTLRLRRQGSLPYDWIADGTRWMRKPTTWGSIDDLLTSVARTYRRALWDRQPAYVEIWCEKEAVAGVLYEVTDSYDVPLMVARGFASETFIHRAAETIRAVDRPAYLYHFGDLDPSGVKAAEAIERRLREFASDVPIIFQRAAVTHAQVQEWNLPGRPTKTRGNSHAVGWHGDSVELDAIPPRLLRQIVDDVIVRHLDPDALAHTRYVEEQERELLTSLARTGMST